MSSESRVRDAAIWLEDRLHIAKFWEATAGHLIPPTADSWFYTLGTATMVCLIIQLVTGSFLAFTYVPSTSEAYSSLEYLNHGQFLGWYLRGIHYWGSNFMVIFMSLHMIQVYLFGAYKYPRELTWVSGVLMLLLTLGMAFTGQVMRWDQDAYWGLGIGASIAGRIPLVGGSLVHLMLAGPTIAGETLTRFFSLHVFIIPGTLLAVLTLHLRLVLTKGINEYPTPGKPVRRETYKKEYAELIEREGIPFIPGAIGKDLVMTALVIALILGSAMIFGPKGPAGVADPTIISANPRPDYWFLPLFAAYALVPDWMEAIAMFAAPAVAILFLFIMPFVFGTGEKSWLRRPVAVLSTIAIMLSLVILGFLGQTSPWSPKMEAWSGAHIPVKYLQGRTPLEVHGALVLQNKQCRNCHSLDGQGGERGPALDTVATKLTHDQLVRQVIQGGGNMPAYGKNLSPAEVDALVSFMDTLRPNYVPGVKNSIAPENPVPSEGGDTTGAGQKPAVSQIFRPVRK